MIPGNYLFTLILLIFSLACLGSWANTLKLTAPKWRFELFAYDFAIGVMVAALIAAFTFGMLGDGFSVMDDFRLAGKRQDFFAFVAGCIFSLANILLLGAIALSGMAVAFPVCFGLALVVGVGFNYSGHPGSPLLQTAGSAATMAAIVFALVAWKKHLAIRAAAAKDAAAALAAEQAAALETTAQVKIASQSKLKKPSKRRPATGKTLALAIFAGLLMGSFYPLLDVAKEGEIGLGPYSIILIFAVGVVFSTFVCNLFFMNLPVRGAPVEFSEYFKGEARQHLLGIVGGILWCAGTTAMLVAGRAEGAAVVGPALSYSIVQGAVVVAAAWGLIAWKEFGEAEGSVRLLLAAMFLLFVVGIGVVSVAPLYAAH